jgi:hypothetical protein
MDIPNDLNKLLLQLMQVTSGAVQMDGAWPSGPRPSAIDVDFFLNQYNFDSDSVIEKIEISKNGVFEFYMFAIGNRARDMCSLLAMWPKQKDPVTGWNT